MILQELHHFYERKSAEPDSGMPPYGTSVENISFALVLNPAGQVVAIEDLREQEGKKMVARKLAVPAAVTRTSGIKANFLWDKSAYVFGADAQGATEQNLLRFSAFREQFSSVANRVDDAGLLAVTRFLENWDVQQTQATLEQFLPWDELVNANFVFRLDGVPGFVHSRAAVQTAWQKQLAHTDPMPPVRCLITGEENKPLARVHTPIKGVQGGQTSGGYIVSFNATAFVSYGQDKASVAEDSAFAYTTALNYLLRRNSGQKIVISDITVAFWAARSSPAEDLFAGLLAPEDTPDTNDTLEDDYNTAKKIHDLLQALRRGRSVVDIVPDLDESVRFFVLGLAPNAARLSIRFWQANDLGIFLKRVGLHFQQLEMVRQFDNEPEFPPLWRLLCQTATLGKSENVSPVLAGGMIKAVLTGNPYPHTLLASLLGRIRAEHMVTYFRAALLKAFLIRNKLMEVPVSLDVSRTDRPYLLGRLFAVLEKAQEEAIPGANATIRDRYLGSAAATPAQVFNMLLKNSANHLGKIRKDPEKTKLAYFYDKIIEGLVNDFDDFPRTMSAEEQGLFMIGYYHQRKDLFVPKAERRTQI